MFKSKRFNPVLLLMVLSVVGMVMFYGFTMSDVSPDGNVYAAPTPELEVIHKIKGNKLMLEFRVQHFELQEKRIGGQDTYGKGYISLAVNDEEVARIHKNLHVLEGLTPGKHTVKVQLLDHDDKPLGIEKTFEIEVKE